MNLKNRSKKFLYSVLDSAKRVKNARKSKDCSPKEIEPMTNLISRVSKELGAR